MYVSDGHCCYCYATRHECARLALCENHLRGAQLKMERERHIEESKTKRGERP